MKGVDNTKVKAACKHAASQQVHLGHMRDIYTAHYSTSEAAANINSKQKTPKFEVSIAIATYMERTADPGLLSWFWFYFLESMKQARSTTRLE